MKLTSYGDLARSFGLQRQTVATKQEVQRLSTEVTTGQAADLTQHLGGDYGPLAGIDASLARLQAHQTTVKTMALFATAMQTALSAVEKTTSDYAASLLTAAGSSQPVQLAAVLKDGANQFTSAVSIYNTRFGDRTLFAGKDMQGSALADAGTILAALETSITGAVGAADIETAVTAWFDAPTGFAAVAYRGGAVQDALAIAPGETAQLDVTADDPAIRDTLKGLALAALLDRGALSGSATDQAALARRAGENLLESQTARAALAARLGTAEGAIDAAGTRNQAEVSALNIARVGLTSIDPYEASTRLEAAQTQLETIYSLTARLSRLSLVDFLR